MGKPQVSKPSAARPIAGDPRLRRNVRVSGILAARFADALLARYGLAPDGDLYPDALLVFRQDEAQGEAQTDTELRLTQLTLRLALQLSSYFSVPGGQMPSGMELHSVRQSLTTCLSTLERRDAATVRELRLLLEKVPSQAQPEPVTAETAAQMLLLRQAVELRLERLELQEPTGRSATVGKATAPHGGPTPPAAGQAEARGQSGYTGRRSPGENPALPGPRLAAGIERLVRATAGDHSPTRPPFAPWIGAADHSSAPLPFAPRIGTADHGLGRGARARTLAEQKERLLRLLSVTDETEREEIWQLVAQSTELVNRHLAVSETETQVETETQLDTMEKLSRVIRRSTYEEYARLLRTMERRFQTGPERPAALPGERPEPGTGPAPAALPQPDGPAAQTPPPQATELSQSPAPAGKGELLRRAAPVIAWLEQALTAGNVRRSRLLAVLQESAAPAQTAFLALAEQSGAFEKTRTLAPPLAEPEVRLTLLARESHRRELEALIRWTRTSEAAAPAPVATSPAQTSPTQTVPTQTALAQTPAPRPLPWEGRADVPDETAAMEGLRQFLSQTRSAERQTLTRIISNAPAEERRALLAQLERGAGPETAEYAALEETERLVYLVEHSHDLPLPSDSGERGTQTQSDRGGEHATQARVEQSRRLEQDVIRRLTEYTQERGSDRAEAKHHLLSGLDEAGQRVLLTQLRAGAALPHAEPDGAAATANPTAPRTDEVTAPTENAEQPWQQVNELLSFRTQKEYKSFRYQLARFLREQQTLSPAPVPAPILVVTLTRWLTERRQTEARALAQAAAPLIARRPAAWYQALTGATVGPQAGLDRAEAAPLSLWRNHGPQSKRDIPRNPAPQPHQTPPPLLSPEAPVAELLRSLATGEGGSYERLLRVLELRQSPPPGVVEAALTGLKAALPSPPPPALGRNPRPSVSTHPPLPLLRQRRVAFSPPERLPRTDRQPPHSAELASRSMTERMFKTTYRAVAQMRTQTTSETIAKTIAKTLAQTQLKTTAVTLSKTLAQLERRTTSETVSKTLTQLRFKPGSEAASQAPFQALSRPLPELLTRRLAPAEPALAPQIAKPAPPPPAYPAEAVELELHRRQSPQELREAATQAAAQAAAQTAAQAAQQQIPALQLLRRQTLEQEQTLDRQQKSLGGLQAQLARQETLMRQVLDRAAGPSGSSPAEVRKLTKAVMKEMEGQLRVERQRRGLL